MKRYPMWKPALVSGGFLGLLSGLSVMRSFPFQPPVCMVGGGMLGMLAAYLYVRRSPTAVRLSRGVALGLLTGAIGTAVYLAIANPQSMVPTSISAWIREVVNLVPLLPSEWRNPLGSTLLTTKTGLWIPLIFFYGFDAFMFHGVTAMLGGAIGVLVFEKRKTV